MEVSCLQKLGGDDSGVECKPQLKRENVRSNESAEIKPEDLHCDNKLKAISLPSGISVRGAVRGRFSLDLQLALVSAPRPGHSFRLSINTYCQTLRGDHTFEFTGGTSTGQANTGR